MGKDLRVENQEKLLSVAAHLPSTQWRVHLLQLANVLGQSSLGQGKTGASISWLPWSCSMGLWPACLSSAPVERGFCSCSYRWHITWFVKILIVCRLVRNPISEAEGEHLIDSIKKWNCGVSLFLMEIFSEIIVVFVKAPWKKWVWRRGIKALSWLFAQLPSSLGSQILFTFLFFQGSSRVNSIHYPFLN